MDLLRKQHGKGVLSAEALRSDLTAVLADALPARPESLGIYIAFQMVVLAALRARIKGWKPGGSYTLGGWGMIVNIVALAYGLFAMYLLVKPYGVPEWSFVDNWIVGISAGLVIVIGLLYMVVARPQDKGDAPAGGAIPAGR